MFGWRDLRHSVRLLFRTPGFTIVAVATLALGIGTSTAIFTVVNALLLRPLPYRDSGNLLVVTGATRGQEDDSGCLTYPRFKLIEEQNRVFTRIAAFAPDSANLTSPGEAEQVRAARVSPHFFEVLGVKPALGRAFIGADEKGVRGEVAIISDALWRRRFGADPKVVGRAMTVDAGQRTIVGVLPASFTFGLVGSGVDIWTPRIDELSLATPEQLRGGTCYLGAVGRLSPTSNRERAQAQMDALNRRYMQEYGKMPDADPKRVVLAEPLQERIVGGFRPMVLTVTAAVALLLLVACANVASLLLARGISRRRELAVRTALGANRRTIAGHLLSESLLLSLAGGAIGLVVSIWGIRALVAATGDVLPRSDEIALAFDPRILWFAIALSVITGMVAGIAPAFQLSKQGLLGVLRTDDRGALGNRRRTSLRNFLVAGQVALSLLLVVGSGLLVRSFLKLQSIPPGFEPRGTLTMNISLSPAKYSTRVQLVDFYERLMSRVQTLPGVEAASLASALPVNPSRLTPILAEGQREVPIAERPVVIIQTFLGSYLKTMKMPLVKGRTFDARDTATSQPVIVINQAFARRFFPGMDPIGRHVFIGRRPAPAEVVGLIGDIRNTTLTTPPAPEIDIPFSQLPWPSMNLTIRSSGEPKQQVKPIRAAIASIDSDLPVTGIQGMDDVLAAARSRQKITAVLIGLFSLCALIVAIVGLYGLIAYSVGQRTQEIGVRMALGATRREVTQLVVRQGVTLAGIGVLVGVSASFAVTRWMTSMLYDVAATDTLTFVVAPLLFVALAVVASWIPARRAGRMDPTDALRSTC